METGKEDHAIIAWCLLINDKLPVDIAEKTKIKGL